MITKTVFLASLDTGAFLLGYAGENEHIKYDIRCDSIFSDYPDATVSMLIKSPDGTVYPKVVTLDKPSVYWVVTASDTANDGNGQVQITFTNGDEVIKTVVASTVTMPSLFVTGEAPDPIATWVDDADEILAKVTGMTATAEGLAAGSSPTATVTEVNGHYNIALGIPKGDKGDKGDTGAQGDPAPSNLVVPAVEDWLDENITNPSSPPLDSSLTLSNAAAPANLVGDLKGALEDVAYKIKKSVSASSTSYFPFTIVAGRTYRLTNNTSNTISSTTRETQSGSNIDSIGDVSAGNYVDYTAEHNAYYLRVWSNASGTIEFEDLGERLPTLEKKTASISSETKISATTGTTVYETMYLKAGEIIIIENHVPGTISVRTRNTTSGSNIETIGDVLVNQTIVHTITTDAVLFGYYSPGNGYVTVKRGEIASILKEFNDYDKQITEIYKKTTVTGTASATSYATFNLKAGETIKIENKTSATINARTRNTVDGANIDTIGNIEAGKTKVYTITTNATLLGFYYSASGSVDVYRGMNVALQEEAQHYYTVGTGERFTTLRSGIAEAIKYPRSIVFVKDGTYDLCSEFAAEITASTASKYGIKLGNDVHVIFSSGALVTASYTGSDSNVTQYFNPFYTDNSGYTIENLNITAKNTRYCIHDENGGNSNPRTVKILNCQFDFDNTSAPVNSYPQCIGGGNGAHDYIEIRGCYFKSKAAESAATQIVSYHQDGTSGTAQSNIYLSDCYFADKGTFRVTYYGSTTAVSKAYVNNCSFGAEPYAAQEVSGGTAPENYALVEWNNVVRT